MKITLIKPNIGCLEKTPYIDQGRMEPLNIGVLAGMIPDDIKTAFYDDRIDQIPFDESTDLAAITVETYTAKRAYEISSEYRKRNVPVILGGMHPTLIPQEASEFADALVTGDAESVWAEVIRDFRSGTLKPLYRGGTGLPQAGILPRRDIFKGRGYLPITLLQFSRGCPFQCNFCATSVYFNKNHTTRTIQDVMYEIDSQDNKLLFFVDDNFIANPAAAKQLLKALIPKKVHWVGQLSIDAALDLELLKLMQQSGCLGFVVGFESIYLENLKWMNKGPNLRQFNQYQSQIRILRDHGFQLWAAFTLGHDYDTIESIEQTLEFAKKNKFAFAAFNIIMPYPGTPLYSDLKAEGRLLYDEKWWLHPDYRFNYAAFKPRHMTPDQLTELCYRARKEFNSPWSIMRRAFDLKTNMKSLYSLFLFLRYSVLFRKEIYKKQAMRFGEQNQGHML